MPTLIARPVSAEVHPLLARVEAALDTLRPYLATDGGNVRVAAITADMVVQLEWEGACGACPMSPMTRAGLEDSVRKAVPEIRAVEAR
ncbi:NifU family protein [uncultured Hymenobacter sp.]|uniref:NifU family protein n=1 Tax=uncultured Hymenobacter sp. TaxID=170016 RepID=UPI0035C9AA5C